MSVTTLTNTPVSHPQSERLSQTVGVVAGAMVAWGQLSPGLGVPADDLSPFERGKAAFQRLLPALTGYGGRFVAVHDGEAVDFDESRNHLVQRFFREHGEGANLYVGFVGARTSVRVPTPFFR